MACAAFWQAQLSSSEFSTWEDLNNTPLKDAKPYITCNERGQEDILKALSNFKKPSQALHLGWSIEFNYKILCARRSDFAILCDINTRVFDFYDLFKDALLQAETSSECLNLLQSNLEKQSSYFNYRHQQLNQIIDSYAAWLSDADNFNYLKSMYTEGKIRHLALDLMDEENKAYALMEWIKSNGYTLDTLYLSNIGTWVRYQPPFMSNVLTLTDENTLCIDAFYGESSHKKLTLRITSGILSF